MNRLCAQFLSAGRPLAFCTTRNLRLRVLQYLVILLCPCRQQICLRGFSPSTASWAGHRLQSWWAGRQKPPTCSVPECRQTPGGLHHQKSKAQGDTAPSDPFVSLQTANMAAGLLSFYSFLGRTRPEPGGLADKSHLRAQFLSAGRPLAVCTTRNLKLRVIQYLVILFCPSRQQIWPRGLLSFCSSLDRTGARAHWAGKQTCLCAQFLSAGRSLAVAPPEI